MASFVRWSGLALLFGGILADLLTFQSFFQPTLIGSSGIASLVAAGLIFVGILGLYAMQAKQAGKLGLIGMALVGIATILSVGLQIWFNSMGSNASDAVLFFLLAGLPILAFFLGISVVHTAGLVLLGIAMNRAAVFPRHCGTGLIITSLLSLVGGGLIYGIYLAVLGYLIVAEKTANPKPV